LGACSTNGPGANVESEAQSKTTETSAAERQIPTSAAAPNLSEQATVVSREPTNLASLDPKHSAMSNLNFCVSKEVTQQVNGVQGRVDEAKTNSIAINSVSACDSFVDAATDEQMAELKALSSDPAMEVQMATVREALNSKPRSEWRDNNVKLKVSFAKTYVSIVADRFAPTSTTEKSGSAIAPNN
jgi:hypothetical protein